MSSIFTWISKKEGLKNLNWHCVRKQGKLAADVLSGQDHFCWDAEMLQIQYRVEIQRIKEFDPPNVWKLDFLPFREYRVFCFAFLKQDAINFSLLFNQNMVRIGWELANTKAKKWRFWKWKNRDF